MLFNRWQQRELPHWRHLANTTELVHPSAHSSPQSKWQMDRFSCFCTAYGRKCLYFTMGAPIHQKCPFPWGIWTSHVTRGAFGPSPFPQIDIIGAMVIVCRVMGKIIRSVLCNIVCNNCAQCNADTAKGYFFGRNSLWRRILFTVRESKLLP